MAELARLLRKVHEDAGEPPLDQMRIGRSSSTPTLSRAWSGQVLPTRECVEAFLRGCRITGGDIHDRVLRGWAETSEAVKAFRPELAGCETGAALVDAVLTLARSQVLTSADRRLHTAELARRLAEAAGSVVGETRKDRRKWTVEAIGEAEIVAEFVDRTRPPTERVLDHVIFACGGIDADVRHWRKHLGRVRELERERHVLATLGSPPHPCGGSGPAQRPPLPSPATVVPTTTASVTTPVAAAPTTAVPVATAALPVTTAALPVTTAASAATVASAAMAAGATAAAWPPGTVRPSRVRPRWVGSGWTRRRVLTATVAGAAGLVVLGGGGVLLATRPDGTTPGIGRAPSSPPVQPGVPVPPAAPATAQDWLGYLAELVRQGTDDPPVGRYAYTRIRLWSRETTPAGRNEAATVEEERLWWAGDLSGLRVVVRTDGGVERRTSHPFPPGELPIVVPSPSTDPAVLAGQLDEVQPPQVGPVGRLRAVADLNMFHPLDRAQRAAALTVLAGTAGLTYRGTVQDRAGRGGIAISADIAESGPSGERVTLVFSTLTGELLSQETSRLPGPEGPDPTDGATSGYVLFLERTRTDRLGG
ncbi:hypothetical protein O7626_07715 [Micromonospora sp. WMMD1102]|uniref:hypothetical protein n=1 Tax=Micromonospora sp. WMMD1102 TaxID=3016105 RepID=UPI002414F4C5|nr:hypothetical protein [Micromonospora sp. WMMD1102]MDG4785814.1 hypothetical protein [Micromonospora sp. WMMD1102]